MTNQTPNPNHQDHVFCLVINSIRHYLEIKSIRSIRNSKPKLFILAVGLIVLFIFTITKSSPPQNFKKTNNDSKYLYQSTNKDFKIELGSRQETNKPKAKFVLNDTQFVEIETETLTAKKTSTKADGTYLYEQISPNTTLTYQQIDNGLKENIILGKAPTDDILSYSFLISFPQNLTIKERDSNEFAFYDQNDQYLFHFPKPFMVDNKNSKSFDVETVLEQIEPKNNLQVYRLTLFPNLDWLKNNDRQYPIIIDPTIITDDGAEPVAFWKFDEASGTVAYDSSGTSNSASLGTGNSSPTWTNGKIGGALKFDGVNDYIHGATGSGTSLDITGNITLEAWVYPDTSDNGKHTIIDRHRTVGFKQYKLAYYGATHASYANKISFQDSAETAKEVFSTTTIPLNQWSHIVATWNNTTVKFYINGIYSNSDGISGSSTSSTYGTVIGADQYDSGFAEYFSGKIDQVKIFNYVRTQRQIANDFSGGAPLILYHFDELKNLGRGVGFTAFNAGTLGVTYNGSLGIGDSYSPTWTLDGKYGGALVFDGNDNVTLTDNGALQITQDITISAWVKRLTSNNRHLIWKQTYSNSGFGLDIWNNSLNPMFYITSSGQYDQTGTADIPTGIWTHIAIVKSGTSVTGYINGVSETFPNTTLATMTAGTNNLNIGNSSFDGSIDEVKIHNYALTASEIKKEFNQGMAVQLGQPKGTGSSAPTLVWKFDENYGTTTNNVGTGGSALNGTLGTGSSAPTWTSSGKYGNALSFDGTNDYVRKASYTEPNSDFSVSYWFKSAVAISNGWIAGGNHKIMVNFGGNPGAYGVDPMGQILDTGVIRGYLYGAAGFPDVSTIQSTWNANQWYHLVFTYNNTDQMIKVYVNSKLDNTHDGSGAPGFGQTNFYVGGNVAYLDNFFQGTIDEVKIFNYTLTPAEVKLDYNQGSAVVMGNPKNILDGGTAPVAFWKLDEGIGTSAYDSTSNGNNGVLTAGTAAPAWITNGQVGSALSFNGINSRVNFAETSYTDVGSTTSSYTVMGWFKTTSNFSVSASIVEKSNGAGRYPFGLRLNSSEYASFAIYDGSSAPGVTASVALNDGIWHHIAGVRDTTNDKLYLYVDGVLIGSTTDTTTQTAANNEDITIGNGGNSYEQYDFTGQIDQVKIYDYARSARQIAMDYSGGAPIAQWKFDEGVGSTVNNVGTGGTALNGTLGTGNSAPTWTTAGKFGKALQFNGTGSYAILNSTISLDSDNWSISWWMKRSANRRESIFSYTYNGSSGFIEVDRVNNEIHTESRTNNVWQGYLASKINTADNNWHHYSVAYGSDSTKLYVDGIFASSTTANSDTADFQVRYFGMQQLIASGYGEFFTGSIDEIKIYPYVLTASEIKLDYNQGVTNFR
jgi:hypothetical protein